MNANVIKCAVSFVAGACGGIAGAYIFLKKRFERKLITEVNELDRYYKERDGITEDTDETFSGEVKEAESPKIYRTNSSESSLVRGEKMRARRAKLSKAKKTDYTSYFKPNGKEMKEDTKEKEETMDDQDWEDNHYAGLEMTAKMNEHRPPKVIKSVDFDSEPGFKTQTLLYYQDNDILTIEADDYDDDDIEDFEEQEALVGDTLTKSGFKTDDTPVIYVRNYSRMTDFEIEKVFGAYEED